MTAFQGTNPDDDRDKVAATGLMSASACYHQRIAYV